MLKVKELQTQNTELKEGNSNFEETVKKLEEEKRNLEEELKLKSDFQETKNKVSCQICLINSILLKIGRKRKKLAPGIIFQK